MTRPLTITAIGNAQISTAQSKFGSSSVSLDGTGDYLNINSTTELAFGTGDFCMEAWVYKTGGTSYHTIFDMRTNGSDGSGIILGINNVNQIYFYYNFGYRITTAAITNNTWTHIALARVNGESRVFINGTQSGVTYTDSNNYPQRGLHIGGDPLGNYNFPGYVDDVRISKGAGRYSGTFTAPATAFTNDEYTSLLIHSDDSNGSLFFIDDALTQTSLDELYIEDNYFANDGYFVYIAEAEASTSGQFTATCSANVFVLADASAALSSQSSSSIQADRFAGCEAHFTSTFTQTTTLSNIYGADLFAFSDAQLAAQANVIREYNLATSGIFDIATDYVRYRASESAFSDEFTFAGSAERSRDASMSTAAAFSFDTTTNVSREAISNITSTFSVSAQITGLFETSSNLNFNSSLTSSLTRINRNVGNPTIVQGGNYGELVVSNTRSKFGGSSLRYGPNNSSYSERTQILSVGGNFVFLSKQSTYTVNAGTGVYISTSSDGINWISQQTDINLGAVNDIFSDEAFSYKNGRYLLTVYNPFVNPNLFYLYSSTNGINWTLNYQSATSERFTDIEYVSSQSSYISANNAGSYTLRPVKSTNLSTWTTQATIIRSQGSGISTKGAATVIAGTLYNSSLVAPRPTVWYSSNSGTTWTATTFGVVDNYFYDITNDGTTWVAVGGLGIIYTSTNGTTWTQRTSGTTISLYKITYTNGIWFAVGYGIILKSTDAINWSQVSSLGGAQRIFYLSGRYQSTEYYSTDSVNWYLDESDFNLPNNPPYINFPDYPGWSTWQTIDFWIYIEPYTTSNTNSGLVYVLRQGLTSEYDRINGWSVALNNVAGGTTSRLMVYQDRNLLTQLQSINAGQWNHIRISRNTNSYAFYFNGNRVETNTGTTLVSSSQPLKIGGKNTYGNSSNIYIDEILITDELLTDPSVASFTPPTTEYINNNSTSLLLHFNENILDDNTAPPRQQIGSASLVSQTTLAVNANYSAEAFSTISSQTTAVIQASAQIGSDGTLFNNVSLTVDAVVIADNVVSMTTVSTISTIPSKYNGGFVDIYSLSSQVAQPNFVANFASNFASISSQLSVVRITVGYDVYMDVFANTTVVGENIAGGFSHTVSSFTQNIQPYRILQSDAVTLSSQTILTVSGDVRVTAELDANIETSLSIIGDKFAGTSANLSSNTSVYVFATTSGAITLDAFTNASVVCEAVKSVDINSTPSSQSDLNANTAISVTRQFDSSLNSQTTLASSPVKSVRANITTQAIATNLTVAAKDVVAWALCEFYITCSVTAVKTARTGSNLNANTETNVIAVKTVNSNATLQTVASVYAAGFTANDATAFLVANGGILTAAVKQASGIVTENIVSTLSATASVTKGFTSQQTAISLVPPFTVERIAGTSSTITSTFAQSTLAGVQLSGVAYINSAMTFAVVIRELRLDEIVYVIPAEIWRYEIVAETRNHKIKGESRIHVITK